MGAHHRRVVLCVQAAMQAAHDASDALEAIAASGIADAALLNRLVRLPQAVLETALSAVLSGVAASDAECRSVACRAFAALARGGMAQMLLDAAAHDAAAAGRLIELWPEQVQRLYLRLYTR